jgi:hypothetical protein
LRSAETRVSALQNEISRNEVKFTREIEELKRYLAEKSFKVQQMNANEGGLSY